MRFFNKRRTEGFISQYHLEDWWISLDEVQRQQIRAQFPGHNIESGHANGAKAQESLALIAQTLAAQGASYLQTAEAAARQSLEFPGGVLEQHHARKLLIELYFQQLDTRPDAAALCMQVAQADLAMLDELIAVWRKEMRQQHREKEPGLPAYPVFDRLIALYQRQGDLVAAQRVCQKAIQRGYTAYHHRLRALQNAEKTSPLMTFIWALLVFGLSSAGLTLIAFETHFNNSPALTAAAAILVWVITLLMLRGGRRKAFLLQITRGFRSRPALAWLILLILVMIALLGGELQHIQEHRDFFRWSLAWSITFFYAAGLTRIEWSEIGAKLRSSRWTGPLISLTTLLMLITGIEVGLRQITTLSDSFAHSLFSKNWLEHHWQPINAQGYRDQEIDSNITADTKRIIVLGDSFAAGYGIERIRDTFPHLLEKKLGRNVRVNVIAQAGWNTDSEWIAVQDYPLVPDLLILSYYLNDIVYVDPEHGRRLFDIFPRPQPVLSEFVSRLYLPNFLYWHIYTQSVQDGEDSYNQLLFDTYKNPELWEKHSRDLQQIIDWTAQNEAELLVMIWPMLTRIEDSAALTQQVEDFFQQRGIKTIDLAKMFAGKSAVELVVNPFDAHPNKAAHALAAEALAEALSNAD